MTSKFAKSKAKSRAKNEAKLIYFFDMKSKFDNNNIDK